MVVLEGNNVGLQVIIVVVAVAVAVNGHDNAIFWVKFASQLIGLVSTKARVVARALRRAMHGLRRCINHLLHVLVTGSSSST